MFNLHNENVVFIVGIVLNIVRLVNLETVAAYPTTWPFGTLARHMLESRASHSPGTTFGIVLISSLLLLDIGLLFVLLNEPVSLLSFLWGALILVSLPALGFIGYWTSSLSSTRYHVVGNALIIEWGRIHHSVPLTQIRSVIRGSSLRDVEKFKGVRWPGCFVGYGRVSSDDGRLIDQETIFYATRPLKAQLLLVTSSIAYCLSPVDLDNFTDCLVALRVPELAGQSEAPSSKLDLPSWRIWQDQKALLAVALAAILNVALFAYLCIIYNNLPVTVPLHFNSSGVVDRLGAPARLFVLPVLGLLSWLANGIIGWIVYLAQGEKIVAHVLWSSAVVVQVVTWIAILGLLT